ncbi:hypothetical protein BH10PSE2_BH10PSE2_23710 [soil metagenome]
MKQIASQTPARHLTLARHQTLATPLAVSLLAVSSLLAGCATTAPAVVLSGAPASADDCAVMAATLEVFSRPLDGTGLKVIEVAAPESQPFLPQRPEQRGAGPISLRGCSFIEVQLVSQGPAVVLGRPEIHDDSVIVSYQEPGAAPVHEVLQREPHGGWRHVTAYLAPPL